MLFASHIGIVPLTVSGFVDRSGNGGAGGELHPAISEASKQAEKVLENVTAKPSIKSAW